MDTESMPAAGYPDLVCDGRGAAANVLVRASVGRVFASEGSQKFPYTEGLGVGRFEDRAQEAHTDRSMLIALVFLFVAGAGPPPLDARLASRST